MQEPRVLPQEEDPRPMTCKKKPPTSGKKGEAEKGRGVLTGSSMPENSKERLLSSKEMQEPRVLPQEEDPRPKTFKKKSPTSAKKGEAEKGRGLTGSSKPKNSKGSQKPDSSESFHGVDGCASDSFPDSGDYRGLRHQYLLLEEESVSLDRELSVVEFEITDLEKEKFGLLDQLVVLEGLVDPSALKSKGGF